MEQYVKFSIPTEVHAALKAYAVAHDRPIVWALRQAVARLTGEPLTPAAASSPPAPAPRPMKGYPGVPSTVRPDTEPHRDLSTGAMAARLRARADDPSTG